jgi:hypothetical protein
LRSLKLLQRGNIPNVAAWRVCLIGLERLAIQLVVHHVELVIRIVFSQVLEVRLPVQIMLILDIPIWIIIIVVGTRSLHLCAAGTEDK